MRNKSRSALLITLLALAVTSATITGAVAEKNPYGGIAVPPPAPNEIIFKVTNASKTLSYSMNSLRALSPKKITIYEPFVKKNQTFTAIPLSALFLKSKIAGKASVRTIALNDYVYANTAKNFLAANAQLAIALDGKPIPYDLGGPIRLIYPKDSVWSKNLDAWNWSLSSISVK